MIWLIAALVLLFLLALPTLGILGYVLFGVGRAGALALIGYARRTLANAPSPGGRPR